MHMTRNPRSGLTLLETMIALFIMAIMAVSISTVFSGGVRLLVRSGIVNGELKQSLARHDLRHWADHAMTAPAPDDPRPLLTGQPDGFDLLVLPPDGPFWAGWATRLTLHPDSMLTAEGKNAQGEVQTLTLRLGPDSTSVSLRYWGKVHLYSPKNWRNDWPVGSSLPDLIQIRFHGSGQQPPPLTVRPARAIFQREMSASSLLPPALPSRP